MMPYFEERKYAVGCHRQKEAGAVDYSKGDKPVSDKESAQIIQNWFFAKDNRDSEEDEKGDEVECIPW